MNPTDPAHTAHTAHTARNQPTQPSVEFQLFPHSETPLHRQTLVEGGGGRTFVFSPVEMRIGVGVNVVLGRKIDRQRNEPGTGVGVGVGVGVGTRGTTREDRALMNVSTDPAHMSTGTASGTTLATALATTTTTATASALTTATATAPHLDHDQDSPLDHDHDHDHDLDNNIVADPQNNTIMDPTTNTAANTTTITTKTAITDCIAFRSKVVSRHHAEIFVGEDGQLYFRDVGSSSGSFLNRLRLSASGKASRPFPLKSGDVIQLGVDYQGRQEEIYKAVMIKIFINSKRSAPTLYNKQRLNRALRSLLHAMNPNSKKEDEHNTTVECCICINSMSPFQALFLAPCSHCFHYKCVTTLLGAGFMFQCPLCRQVANLEAGVAEPEESGVEYEEVEEDEEDEEDEEEEVGDVEMEIDPIPTTTSTTTTAKRNPEKRTSNNDASIHDLLSSDEEVAGRLEMDDISPSIAVNIPGPSRILHPESSIVSPSTPQNTVNLPAPRRPDVPVQIFNTLNKLSDVVARQDEDGVRECMDEYAGQICTLVRGICGSSQQGNDLISRMADALRDQ